MEKISKKGARTAVVLEGTDPADEEVDFEIIIDIENDIFEGRLGDMKFSGDWTKNLRKLMEELLSIEGGD